MPRSTSVRAFLCLSLLTSAPLAPVFAARVERAWRQADRDTGVTVPLEFREGAPIEAMPGGKVENLLSELQPGPDA